MLLLAAGLALLAGCGGGGDYEPEIRAEEKRIGAEQHPQLLAEFGGAYRAPEAAYARRVGEKVAAAAGLDGQCTFTLVNSDVVNAFAVPGCYIYVTRGLMGIVNSEAELASVLGHEVGHIVAAHNRRQQQPVAVAEPRRMGGRRDHRVGGADPDRRPSRRIFHPALLAEAGI